MSKLLHSLKERFWNHVEIKGKNECWLWHKGKRYGSFSLGSRKRGRMKAHRFSLSLKLGRLLKATEQSLHTCDNPPCVNPYHLFKGDHKKNMEDMARKGRSRLSKIVSDEKVLQIRKRYHAGEMQDNLAKEFGVNRRMIQAFVKGRRRHYVGGPMHPEDMRKTRSGGQNKL